MHVPLLQHEQLDNTVIHQYRVARGNIVHQPFVIHVHRKRFLALRPAHRELQNISRR